MKKITIVALAILFLVMPVFAQGVGEKVKTDKLVIWSGAAEDEAAALVKKFNELHPGINVSVIRAGSTELVNRLYSEQPRPEGDILLMIAKENMELSYEYLAPYKSVNHDAIDASVRDNADVPRFYGSSMPLQAIMVNTNLLKPSEYPKGWADLVDPRFKGEIILANPALSGSAYAQLYMIYKQFDDVHELAENTVFTASPPPARSLGAYAITVTGESNIGKYIGRSSGNVRIRLKEPAPALTPRRSSPTDRTGAKPFMDFITSIEGYEIIRTTETAV